MNRSPKKLYKEIDDYFKREVTDYYAFRRDPGIHDSVDITLDASFAAEYLEPKIRADIRGILWDTLEETHFDGASKSAAVAALHIVLFSELERCRAESPSPTDFLGAYIHAEKLRILEGYREQFFGSPEQGSE